jgi:hypothetical protein
MRTAGNGNTRQSRTRITLIMEIKPLPDGPHTPISRRQPVEYAVVVVVAGVLGTMVSMMMGR